MIEIKIDTLISVYFFVRMEVKDVMKKKACYKDIDSKKSKNKFISKNKKLNIDFIYDR